MEKPVSFLNTNGKKLFGIVHIPEGNLPYNKKAGVNLLSPGIKYRVAPNRINVKLARRLCKQGYYVIRCDPEGIGDSEGELPDKLLTADIWEKIQKGLFVSDTIAINDYFIETYGIEKLILIGNCGGAITALLTSAEDSRIEGLALIDVPVNLRIAKQTFADKVAPGSEKADWLFTEYLKRMTRFESWYRFVTLQTNYRALFKTITLKLRESFFPSSHNHLNHNIDTLCNKHNLNRLFYQSFESFSQSVKPILFIIAGNDRGTEIFQNYFQSIYFKNKDNHPNARIHKIEGANHIYTLYEWQEELINNTINWISEV